MVHGSVRPPLHRRKSRLSRSTRKIRSSLGFAARKSRVSRSHIEDLIHVDELKPVRHKIRKLLKKSQRGNVNASVAIADVATKVVEIFRENVILEHSVGNYPDLMNMDMASEDPEKTLDMFDTYLSNLKDHLTKYPTDTTGIAIERLLHAKVPSILGE